MEEEKAAAYYEELTRKGEGAARFKQGLGFSSSPSATNRSVSPPSRGSALPSSSASSFLNAFVKASSPPRASKYEKDAQLESIHNKLKKRKENSGRDREKSPRVSESSRYRRSRSREREYRERERSRRRSRSRSPRRERRSGRRSRSPDMERKRRSEKERSNVGVDYSKLIDGYDKLTPADRVKARMKLQLDETAGKDKKKGMGAGWERFEFDKDAPLDDEEMEVAEDDEALVKHIGQSFRFSSLEAKREEQIKAAHDAAIFGAPSAITPVSPKTELEVANEKKSNKTEVTNSLLSETVLAKQQGSWRDRARKA